MLAPLVSACHMPPPKTFRKGDRVSGHFAAETIETRAGIDCGNHGLGNQPGHSPTGASRMAVHAAFCPLLLQAAARTGLHQIKHRPEARINCSDLQPAPRNVSQVHLFVKKNGARIGGQYQTALETRCRIGEDLTALGNVQCLEERHNLLPGITRQRGKGSLLLFGHESSEGVPRSPGPIVVGEVWKPMNRNRGKTRCAERSQHESNRGAGPKRFQSKPGH